MQKFEKNTEKNLELIQILAKIFKNFHQTISSLSESFDSVQKKIYCMSKKNCTFIKNFKRCLNI
jgi:hypothetical protein